ncbi:MAG TPA: inositol monophosphatase family protein [Aldersonia sp.]
MPGSDADSGPIDLRATAVRIAEEAAAHVRARRPEVFGGSGAARVPDSADAVQAKSSPTDPVTVVDTETEQLIRALLAQQRPGDPVLGEEGGGSAAAPAGVRWVVDPIDGTVNFLYGIPAYAVSVAAQIDGSSVAGAVVDVAAGLTYSAALGHGACRHDRDGVETTLQASTVDAVGLALVATGFGYGAHRRAAQGRIVAALLPRVRDIRRIGSAALDLCMVASGLVDAHYEHGLSPWDWAAGSLIAAEAGARVHTPEPTASSADGQVLVACAPGIAAELDAVLDELGAFTPLPDA